MTPKGPGGCGYPVMTMTPATSAMPGPRAGGVRQLRRASNWTAAALIAVVAAATGYFAHHASPATPTVTTVTGTAPGTGTAGPGKPTLSSPVAASTGSGVVVTTGPGGVKTYHYRGDH